MKTGLCTFAIISLSGFNSEDLFFCLQETYKLPHRLIEKKRRDRINECIAQLKDLLPEHLKLTVSLSFSTQQPKYETPDGAAGKSFALQVDDKCEHVFLFLQF